MGFKPTGVNRPSESKNMVKTKEEKTKKDLLGQERAVPIQTGKKPLFTYTKGHGDGQGPNLLVNKSTNL